MVFLGLEQPVAYGRQQVFDPTTAQMVLNANKDYINAVYNDYQQARQDMKDFQKEYGDFLSPIQADMDWYEQNVTGNIRDFVNDLYARGIDPLRSQEGRALVAMKLANMPTAGINAVRQSAKNANELLNSIAKLKEQGLYNPETAALEMKPLDQYSTMDRDGVPGDGILSVTGITPYQNMAQFSKDYFDNLKPSTRAASKNGISYKVSEISEQDLHNIADAHYNDLVSTPQGQLMYKVLKNRGLSDEQARAAFNDMVVSGNRDRLFYSDDYDDNYFKHQHLAIERQKLALQKMGLEQKAQKSAQGKEVTSYSQTLMQRGIAKWAGSTDPGPIGIDLAKRFGEQVRQLPLLQQRTDKYLEYYGMQGAESSTAFRARFAGDSSRFKDAPTGGVNYSPTADKQKLFTGDEVASGTLGYPGAQVRDDHAKNSIPADAAMVPTGNVVTVPTKNGNYTQYVEIKIGNSDDNKVMYYKVGETEKSPVVTNNQDEILHPFTTTGSDTVFAPAGFSVVPSQETMNQWSIQDHNLNSAAGIGGDPIKQGTGYFLDELDN